MGAAARIVGLRSRAYHGVMPCSSLRSSLPLLVVRDLRTPQIGPLSFELRPGELIQVSGVSGAGKSLLLRALADLDPASGTVLLDGRGRETFSPSNWRARVAYLAADSAWWGERVGDHFDLNRRAIAESWLNRLDLPAEALSWTVERLSSGERQRLAFARALVAEPQVLLLDEPTANLDLANTQRLERAVSAHLTENDAGVVWVSHDEVQRHRLGGRCLILEKGRFVREITA